jgi:enolase
MSKIKDIKSREILDSRGNPTVEVECYLEGGGVGIVSVPSGASTGKYEAIEKRDEDKRRFKGKGVLKVVEIINEKIAPRLKGVEGQYEVDRRLIEMDGTPNKSKLGANACVGVSLAHAVAEADELKIPVYKWIGGEYAKILPVPMLNIINGGKHADNNLEVQEFMIMPVRGSFKESIRCGVEVFFTLKELLKKKGLSTNVGDEGGVAPNLRNNREACELIIKAIEGAGYKPGKDVFIGLDVAASELEENGKYRIEGKLRESREVVELYKEWVKDFPIFSIEDGLAEEDWDGWKLLTRELGKNVMLVGDDLFVTNLSRLKKGIKLGIGNAILVKPNQIGTLTETLNCIRLASRHNYRYIISHRSGETDSTFISHLAIGTNAGFIKAGAPSRMERVAKYNEIIRIEEKLGDGEFLGVNEEKN